MTEEEELRAKCKGIKCLRCTTEVVDEPSLSGTTLVNYFVPILDTKKRGVLCGKCSVLFMEFLDPLRTDNPLYQVAKQELLSQWAA